MTVVVTNHFDRSAEPRAETSPAGPQILGIDDLKDLMWALINTAEFRFIY